MNQSYIQLLVDSIPQDLARPLIRPGSTVQMVRLCPICNARFMTPVPAAVRISPDDLKAEIYRLMDWQKKATRELMLDHIEAEHPLEIAKAALHLIVE